MTSKISKDQLGPSLLPQAEEEALVEADDFLHDDDLAEEGEVEEAVEVGNFLLQ
jgi:hypothetical protein